MINDTFNDTFNDTVTVIAVDPGVRLIAAALTFQRQHAMLEEVRDADRQAAKRDYEEHCAAVRAARMPNPVLADSIDRILTERPYVEPAIVQALEGYPYFD